MSDLSSTTYRIRMIDIRALRSLAKALGIICKRGTGASIKSGSVSGMLYALSSAYQHSPNEIIKAMTFIAKDQNMPYYALRSSQSHIPSFPCKYAWGEDCFLQCGENALEINGATSRRTAFFEAFPRVLDTFIRGEGETLEDAEEQAWISYSLIKACPKHEMVRGPYTNGAGYCIHCKMFQSSAFVPLTVCCICGTPTNHSMDIDRGFYCILHDRDKPLSKWTFLDWQTAYSENFYFDHNRVAV